ncbi:hypothetical protein AGATL06_06010 [Agathobaculum sp. TL06]
MELIASHEKALTDLGIEIQNRLWLYIPSKSFYYFQLITVILTYFYLLTP